MSFPMEVRARVAYTARNAQEMGLVAGQTYTVTGQDPTGQWYKTQNPATSSTAWIPMSYCDKIESDAAQSAPTPSAGRGRVGVPMPGMGDPSALANRGRGAPIPAGRAAGGPPTQGAQSSSASPGPQRAISAGSPSPALNLNRAAQTQTGDAQSAPLSPGAQRSISAASPTAARAVASGTGGPPHGGRGIPMTGMAAPAPASPNPARAAPPANPGGPPLRTSGPPGSSTVNPSGPPPISGTPPGRSGPPIPGGGPPTSGGPPPLRPNLPPVAARPPLSGGPPQSRGSDEETYEIDDTPEEERGYKWGGVGDRNDGYKFKVDREREAKEKSAAKAAARAAAGPVATPSFGGYSGVGPWNCEKCKTENAEQTPICRMCGATKPDPVIEGPWECRGCHQRNKEQLLKCPMCGQPKPDKTELHQTKTPKMTEAQRIAMAYAYVPPVIEEKKHVDPDDPFGDVELIEWGTKKKRW